jgi:thimet oligopeptidase
VRYIEYQIKKNKYSLDEEKIKEYFPSDKTVEKMFEIYSTLLGVKFERVKEAKVWSPDVQFYRVIDKQTHLPVAYFYTDFIPREGKFSHAAAFPLRTGKLIREGTYLKPIAAIVANFTPPSDGKPSLLTHDEVETLFHEFGHIMHHTLSKAPYSSLSGFSVARDFIEAPSQMLEEWVWSPKILNQISGHYKNPAKKLPAHLIQKMIAARKFGQSHFYTRQLWLGNIDMAYHSNPDKNIDTTAVQLKMYKDIIGLDGAADTHFEARFGHLMGYDAGYYGYLWSEVYAKDMFTLFEKEGLLSSKAGSKYRKVILEQGNMKDALDLVKEFLGRNPSPKPFYRFLGI